VSLRARLASAESARIGRLNYWDSLVSDFKKLIARSFNICELFIRITTIWQAVIRIRRLKQIFSSLSTQMASESTSEPMGAQAEPMFQIKKINLVALWRWIVDSDVCAICRANLMDACSSCHFEDRVDECAIVWGPCKHSFHNCCILKWVQQSNTCPMCQHRWESCKNYQLN